MRTQSDFFQDKFKTLVVWELQEVLKSTPSEFLA